MALRPFFSSPSDLPASVALFPLSGCILLPFAHVPLNIFEPRYMAMVEDILRSPHRLIGIIQPKSENNPDLMPVGCLGRMTQFTETDDGRYFITLTGISRFTLKQELAATTLYRQGVVNYTGFEADLTALAEDKSVDRSVLLSGLQNYLNAKNFDYDWPALQRAPTSALVNSLSVIAPWGVMEKQALLEAKTLNARAELLLALGQKELIEAGAGGAPHLQ